MSKTESYEIESRIVDKNFVKRKDTYNMGCGGYGGNMYAYMSPDEIKLCFGIVAKKKMSDNHADVSGSKNPRAKKMLCITSTGEHIILHGSYLAFAKEQNISYNFILKYIDKGVINAPILKITVNTPKTEYIE